MGDILKDVNGAAVFIVDPVRLEQKVGIFWCVDDVILGDAVVISEGESYGSAIQHGGHYDYWLLLKPSTSADKKLKSHAYDYYPRGRMVFFPERNTVRLYFDSCMNNENLNTAMDFFGHGEHRIEIEKDEHYQCACCNRHYLE